MDTQINPSAFEGNEKVNSVKPPIILAVILIVSVLVVVTLLSAAIGGASATDSLTRASIAEAARYTSLTEYYRQQRPGVEVQIILFIIEAQRLAFQYFGSDKMVDAIDNLYEQLLEN